MGEPNPSSRTSSERHTAYAALAALAALGFFVFGAQLAEQKRTAMLPDTLPPEPPPPCLLAITASSATAYERPDTRSAVFGTLPMHQVASAGAIAENGWIGFEPPIEQPGAVGPFRLRWLPPDTPVSFSPGCPDGPDAVATIPAAACFAMAATPVPVYGAPGQNEPIGSLPASGYAEALSQDGAFIEIAEGENPVPSPSGWVDRASVALNGECDLPQR